MTDEALRLSFGGMHPDRVAELVERYGDPSSVLGRISSRGIRVSESVRAAVAVPAETRRRLLSRSGISYVGGADAGFPRHLADLPDAPLGLFVRGELPSAPGVAVVGTRRCTRYGLQLAESYGRAIAAAGWILVSGLALGIDGAAHRGTVGGGGIGVGVLGCGVDVTYPRAHGELADRLLGTGGAIVSEYPPGSTPLAWRFPPRNRIISGLSRAVVVVEAGVRGGALITARKALDQGVAVFAVPGDVGRETSRGCNLLIRDGAHPVLDAGDLIEELALVMGPPTTSKAEPAPADDPILSILRSEGPVGIDIVCDRLARPVGVTLAEIVRLEAAGLVTFDGVTISRP